MYLRYMKTSLKVNKINTFIYSNYRKKIWLKIQEIDWYFSGGFMALFCKTCKIDEEEVQTCYFM